MYHKSRPPKLVQRLCIDTVLGISSIQFAERILPQRKWPGSTVASLPTEPIPEPPTPRGCLTDGECPSKQACFNGQCEDPCQVIQPCGTNARCHVIDTLPFRTMTCECLEGYAGNAYMECILRKLSHTFWFLYILITPMIIEFSIFHIESFRTE